MSLGILPFSPEMSQILIGVSICIILIALVFAIIILFRQEKGAITSGRVNYYQNSTKVPDLNQEKIHYGEQELLAEILPDEESHLTKGLFEEKTSTPATENLQVFVCSDLQINPSIVKRDQKIEISCKICNQGATTDSYLASLRINGKPMSSQYVTLSRGTTKKIIFIGTEQIPGTYIVELSNLRGSFSVSD